MNKIFAVLLVGSFVLGLSACTRQAVGAGGGAVVGGLVGHAVGGNTVGTVIGAGVGAAAGATLAK